MHKGLETQIYIVKILCKFKYFSNRVFVTHNVKIIFAYCFIFKRNYGTPDSSFREYRKRLFVFLDPRSSAFILGLRPLVPRPSAPKILHD